MIFPALLIATLSTAVPTGQLQGAPLDSARRLYGEAYRLELGSDSVPPDTVAANRLYLEAARMGYLPAQNFIGYRLLKGEGTERNVEEGLYWLEQAAENGETRAEANLGFLLANGQWVERDDEKAFYWLSRAAEKGFAPALSQLGDFYRDGRTAESDSLKAASLYLEAADAGLPDAASKLIHLSGIHRMDIDSIITRSGAEKIKTGLPACFLENPGLLTFIARCYALGYGVPYSYDKSLQIYRLAADCGDQNAIGILDELRGQFPDHPILRRDD